MDYPKMLYMGNLAVYQTAIAESEDHEFDLKEEGWLEYGELSEVYSEPNPKDVIERSLIPVEQFDALALKVVDLEEENASLKDFITKGSAENTEQREQLTLLKDGLIKSENQNKTLVHKLRIKELEDLKMDELQKILTEKEISFNVRDGKPMLIDLIANSELPQSL